MLENEQDYVVPRPAKMKISMCNEAGGHMGKGNSKVEFAAITSLQEWQNLWENILMVVEMVHIIQID